MLIARDKGRSGGHFVVWITKHTSTVCVYEGDDSSHQLICLGRIDVFSSSLTSSAESSDGFATAKVIGVRGGAEGDRQGLGIDGGRAQDE